MCSNVCATPASVCVCVACVCVRERERARARARAHLFACDAHVCVVWGQSGRKTAPVHSLSIIMWQNITRPTAYSPPPFFVTRVNTLVSPPGAEGWLVAPGAEGWLVAPRHIVITTKSNLEIVPAQRRRRRPWPW